MAELRPPKHSSAPIKRPENSKRLLYMFGAVTQIELNNYLELNTIDLEERKNEIKTQWLRAAEVFQGIVKEEAGIPESIVSKSLAPEAEEFTQRLRKTSAFAKGFSNYPFTFEDVEIDKIVAAQRTVDLDYIERIRSANGKSVPELLPFCLETGQDQTSVNAARTAQNAFTFSSENPGLRFLGASESVYDPQHMEKYHQGGQPVRALTILLGYGSSTINVYRVGRRLILNNGFHRLYALKSMGVSFAPVVVQAITHPELELPEVIAELPRNYLVSSPRPGLLRDFFDARLNCEVHQRRILKALQVSWGINESMIPR